MYKLTKQSSITLVELPATQFGILNGDRSFDVYSKSNMPSRATHTLEAVIRDMGFTDVKSVKYFDENRILNSDVSLMSFISRTALQSIEGGRIYKLAKPEGTLVMGGSHATFRVEECMQVADIVVRGEGEKTLYELMNRLLYDPNDLADINGIAFKKNGEIIVTNPRKLMTNEELSQIPYPYYDDAMRKNITTGVIETSRGCIYKCNFCTEHKINEGKYRVKSINYVIEGLRQTKDMGSGLFFVDNDLNGAPNRTIDLLETIAEEGLNNRFGIAQVTVHAAKNLRLMKAMKNAGIRILCVGVESINDETLRALGKPSTAQQNKEAIKILRDYGFWIHGMFMPGGEGDTLESLKEDAQWINKNVDSIQLFPPGPLPGSDLYNLMEEQGRILTKKWFLYDGHHVLIRPNDKKLTPYKLQEINRETYEDFYSIGNSFRRLVNFPNRKTAAGIFLYNHIFRGMEKVLRSPQTQAHLKFLKSIS